MTEKECNEYIESLNVKGSILGLERMAELLKRLGNPEEKLKFIHIAGTNGKGSILAFTSTILKNAGYRVGRYISPVICDYREKIQINGRMITKKALYEGMSVLKAVTDEMDDKPTIFEVETALAFWYFAANNCDIVTLETGLGGRDDATNVIKNTLVCAFASISLDHMAILGKTVTEIAKVKAGIIKKAASVVISNQSEEIVNVIKDKFEEVNANKENVSLVISDKPANIKYKLGNTSFDLPGYKKLVISLAGTWQPENAAVSVAIINQLRKLGYSIEDKAVYSGLKETKWYGRFSVLSKKPMIICDGAHNENASLRLQETIKTYLQGKHLIYIMGVLKDKEYDKVIRNTVSLADHIVTVTPPNNERSLSAYELAMAVREYNNNVTEAGSVEEAVELAQLLAGKDCVIIAFGSLSYLGKLKSVVEDYK